MKESSTWGSESLVITRDAVARGIKHIPLLESIALGETWGTAEGLEFVEIPENKLPAELAEIVKDSPAEIGFELVRVVANVPLHIHKLSGGTIYISKISGNTAGIKMYIRRAGETTGTWRTVHEGETIDIPPGTAHGFEVEAGTRMHLLSVNTPRLKEDDRHFVKR